MQGLVALSEPQKERVSPENEVNQSSRFGKKENSF